MSRAAAEQHPTAGVDFGDPTITRKGARPAKEQPDPGVLQHLYLDNRYTINEIASLLAISRASVTSALKAAGVQWRSGRTPCPINADQLRALMVSSCTTPGKLARTYGVARNTAARWLADAGLLEADPAINNDDLRELYVNQQLTTRELASKLGVDKSRILRALATAGIPARPREIKRPRSNAAGITVELLTNLYSEPGMTIRQAANQLGVSNDFIARRLIENGVAPSGRVGPRRKHPNAKLCMEVSQLYNGGMAIRKIAGNLEISQATVRKALHATKTPVRRGGRRKPDEPGSYNVSLYTDPEIAAVMRDQGTTCPSAKYLLSEIPFLSAAQRSDAKLVTVLYVDVGLGIHDIAMICDVSDATIHRRLRQTGIPLRPANQPSPWNQRRLAGTPIIPLLPHRSPSPTAVFQREQTSKEPMTEEHWSPVSIPRPNQPKSSSSASTTGESSTNNQPPIHQEPKWTRAPGGRPFRRPVPDYWTGQPQSASAANSTEW